jgi:hypothetical protein
MKYAIVAVLAALTISTGTAEARRYHRAPAEIVRVDDRYPVLAQYGTSARDVAREVRKRRGVHARPRAAQREVETREAETREWDSGRALVGKIAGWAGRPAAWCGWWMGKQLGLLDRSLWLARNWARVGTNAGGPAVGAVVVWPHHVGIITGKSTGGRWVVKSGNDGHAVRERPRRLDRAIAFRFVRGAGRG